MILWIRELIAVCGDKGTAFFLIDQIFKRKSDFFLAYMKILLYFCNAKYIRWHRQRKKVVKKCDGTHFE